MELAVASTPVQSLPAPVNQAERITAIDTLRGFALLGILLMNIVAMGMYGPAYDDPTVTGGDTGPNLWVWALMHVMAEGKMRCLFSMVFGASIILLTSRLERRQDAADIYYRRNLWLLAFGVVHSVLLWMGDILYPYAVCALALYPFRKLAPRRLVLVGVALIMVDCAFYVREGFENRGMIEKGRAAVLASQQNKKLTDEQEEAKLEYEKFLKRFRPTPEVLKKAGEGWRGNPWRVIKTRATLVYPFQAIPYYHWWNLDIWSMMLIGMGLLKMDVLGAGLSRRFYGTLALLGYGIGIPLNSLTAWIIIRSHFDPVVHSWANSTYDLGRLTVACGHLGIIMLMCRSARWNFLTERLGAIGQMAFSNYIFQSVVTAFLFTGYGFALWGKLQRYQLYFVVIAIWIVQLAVSPIWARHFRFGPLEWCWRSLTYWKHQPMRLNRDVGQVINLQAG